MQKQRDAAERFVCHNCGQEYAGSRRCPACGASRAGAAAEAFTGLPWADTLLGFLACAVLISTGIGAVVAMVLYMTLKEKQPYFAGGIKGGCFLAAILLLGAIAWCFVGIGRGFS